MKRLFAFTVVVLLLLLEGCGGGSSTGSTNTQNSPQIAGAWEFLATSSQSPGYTTLIETNLQQNGSSISAAGSTQIQLLGEQPSSIEIGGNCPGNGVDSVNGTVSSSNAITLTLNEGGNVFNASGNFAMTSPETMTGTYTSSSGTCPDSGTFTGYVVAPLAGTYSGEMLLPDNSHDYAVATVSEVSPAALSVTFVVSGFDNGSYTLTGSVVANTFTVQGSVLGYAVVFDGYYNPNARSLQLATPVNGSFLYLGTLVAQ